MGTYEDDLGSEVLLNSGQLAPGAGWTLLEGTVNKIGPEVMIHLELGFAANAGPAALVLPNQDFLPPRDVHTENGLFVVRGPAGVNAEHTLTVTGTPTGGDATLDYASYGSIVLPFNATASSAQALFNAVFGAGNTLIGGGALPGAALTVSFQGSLAGQEIALPTITGAYTGGSSPALTPTATVAGAVPGEIDYLDSTSEANAGPIVCEIVYDPMYRGG